MKTITVMQDLWDESYTSLLEFLAKYSSRFSFVWRDQLEFNQNAEKIENQLLPYLTNEERTDTWPGTKIDTCEAIVRHYAVNLESIGILKTAGHLFAWLSPEYPEDLAFYSKRGKVLMGSIVNEDIAFLTGEEFTLEQVKGAITDISLFEQEYARF